MSQPVKLSDELILDARLTAEAAERSIAGQIETLLLNETPVIYAYFYNYLTASAKNVNGVYPTAVGHLFLNNVTKA